MAESVWSNTQKQSLTGQPDMKKVKAGIGAMLTHGKIEQQPARSGSIKIGSAAKKAAMTALGQGLVFRTGPPGVRGVAAAPAAPSPPPAADKTTPPQRPPPPPAKPAMMQKNKRIESTIQGETMAGKKEALRKVYNDMGIIDGITDEFLEYYVNALESNESVAVNSTNDVLKKNGNTYILTQKPAVEQEITAIQLPVQQEYEDVPAPTPAVIKPPSIKVEPASGSRNITGEKADKKLKKAAHDELKTLTNYNKQKDAIKLKLRTKFGYKSGSATEQTHWNIVQEKLVESMNSTDAGAEIEFTLEYNDSSVNTISVQAIASVYGDNMILKFVDEEEESKIKLRTIVGKKKYETGKKIIMKTVLDAFNLPQKAKLFNPFWLIIKKKLLESYKTGNKPIQFELKPESGNVENFTAQVIADGRMIVKPTTKAKATEVKKYAKRNIEVIKPFRHLLGNDESGDKLGRLLLCDPDEFKEYDKVGEYKFDGYSKHSGLVNSWKSHVAGNKPFFRRYILFWSKCDTALKRFNQLLTANPKLALRFCIMFLNACSAPTTFDADNSKFFNHLLNNDMDFLDTVCQDILSFLIKDEILADKFGLFAIRKFTYLPNKYEKSKGDDKKVEKYEYFTVTVGAKFESLGINFNSGIISKFDEARYQYEYIGSAEYESKKRRLEQKTKRAANPGIMGRFKTRKVVANEIGSGNKTEV